MIPASQIYSYVSGSTDNNYNDERLSNVDRVLIGHGVSKKTVLSGDEEKIKSILDKKVINPEIKYEFLQELEKAVLEDNPPIDNAEEMQFDPVVGFTAPFENMKTLDPRNIAIIQVLIRKNSQTNHYSQEAEIRADPKDLVILRFLQP